LNSTSRSGITATIVTALNITPMVEKTKNQMNLDVRFGE
jgi:hypothetical protein